MRGRATQSGHLLARKGEVRRLQQSLRPASATPSSATSAAAPPPHPPPPPPDAPAFYGNPLEGFEAGTVSVEIDRKLTLVDTLGGRPVGMMANQPLSPVARWRRPGHLAWRCPA